MLYPPPVRVNWRKANMAQRDMGVSGAQPGLLRALASVRKGTAAPTRRPGRSGSPRISATD